MDPAIPQRQYKDTPFIQKPDDYRNDRAAFTGLTDGLQRPGGSAVRLPASEAHDIGARFGQLGGRRLAMAG